MQDPGFLIAQKKHGTPEHRGTAGGKNRKDEVGQLIEADRGQHGIAELVKQGQFIELLGSCGQFT